MDLGRFGVWRGRWMLDAPILRTIEEAGFGAIWIGGSPPADLAVVEDALDDPTPNGRRLAMPGARSGPDMWTEAWAQVPSPTAARTRRRSAANWGSCSLAAVCRISRSTDQ